MWQIWRGIFVTLLLFWGVALQAVCEPVYDNNNNNNNDNNDNNNSNNNEVHVDEIRHERGFVIAGVNGDTPPNDNKNNKNNNKNNDSNDNNDNNKINNNNDHKKADKKGKTFRSQVLDIFTNVAQLWGHHPWQRVAHDVQFDEPHVQFADDVITSVRNSSNSSEGKCHVVPIDNDFMTQQQRTHGGEKIPYR